MAVDDTTNQEPQGEPSAEPVEPDTTPSGEPEPAPEPSIVDYSEALPAELRGKSPQEVQSTLQALVKTLDYQGQEIERLRSATAQQTAAPATSVEPDTDLKDLIYDDPEAAVVKILQKNFGQQASRWDSAGDAAILVEARGAYHDFNKYENDVRTLISQSGQPISRENVQWAYLALKGNETYQREIRQMQGGPKSQKPTPESDPSKPKRLEFKNDLERSIFENSRMTEKEWMENRGDGMITLDVPGVD